jgi:hypothetical protein
MILGILLVVESIKLKEISLNANSTAIRSVLLIVRWK